jgi:hypothetical protein
MTIPALTESEAARFLRHLLRDSATGCLIYIGYRDANGYGRFRVRNATHLAHRVAFVLGGGVLLDERPYVLHNCPLGDTPACCEFSHLRAGTQAENIADMAAKARGTKSPRGYPVGVRPQTSKRGQCGTFQARIKLAGREVYLGSYPTVELASAAVAAQRRLHYGSKS